ncbi:MAG TPA: hypothetical protein VHA37_04420 [Candidatus Saccharimonadales bacterium]|nr:hypothetical protein [Candidatus Saccharimonadales bacterium]
MNEAPKTKEHPSRQLARIREDILRKLTPRMQMVPNLLGIGRNSAGELYIEHLGRWLPREHAINATAWLNLVMSKEQDEVAALMVQILGEDSSTKAPTVAGVAPAALALLTLRTELEQRIEQANRALLQQQPRTDQRSFLNGYIAGLDKALTLLPGADGLAQGCAVAESNGGSEP